MYVEHFTLPTTSRNITLHSIWRLKADHTYQVYHPVYDPKKLIFIYTNRGQGQLQYSEGPLILEEKTALLLSGDTTFYYRTANDHWDFWWVDFSGDCPCEKNILYQIQDHNLTEALFQKIMFSIRQNSAAAAAYFFCLLTSAVEQTTDQGNLNQEIFCKAQTLIKENLYHINASAIAQILSITPRTLYNLFCQYAGCSPKTYLQNYVIDKGKYLLSNTTKSIGDISDELGFSNQFHFSRFFKEKANMTPSSYRQKCRQNWKL